MLPDCSITKRFTVINSWFSKPMRILLVALSLVWLVFPKGFAQQTRLTLVDKVSGEVVAFAHVLGEPISQKPQKPITVTTSISGEVSFDLTTPIIVNISFVGYLPASDTLYPGIDKKLLLEPCVYNVDEVVVTGQIAPERVDKSIYKVKVISSLAISQKAAVNLSEMLAGELNIRSTRDNIFGSSIVMQGLGGEHVKFLVDGVPVIGRQNGQLDLQQMNMQDVDHLEIIEGPMSVIYGSNALAGVINIITKQPDRTRLSAYGELYTETVGVYNASVGGSYSKGKNSVSLNGSRNFFGGFSEVDTSRWKQWKPKLQYDTDFSYMFKTAKTSVKATVAYFSEEIRDKGYPSPVFNLDKAFDKYFYTDRWTTRAEFNQSLFNSGNLNVVGAYSYYRRAKNTWIKDLTNLSETLYVGIDSQDTSWFDNILVRPVFSNSLPNNLIKYQLGFDITHESGGGKRVENEHQEIGDYATFLSLAYTPLPQLDIQPGIRYIYNTKYKAPLVYSLNVKWNIREEFAIRASVAKGFRAPSLKELYLYFVDINHNIIGNPDLEAETSQNISMDLTYNTQKASMYNWGIDLGLFYNHLKNKIQLQSVSEEQLIYTYVNVDQYYTQGFDVSFNNRVYPWLKLVLGYATTGRKLVLSSDGPKPDFIYSTDVTVQSNVHWKKTALDFSLFYKYNGAYPELTLGENDEQVISTIDAYNTLDMNVGRWFYKHRLNIQAGVKNLFDNTNIAASGGGGGGTGHSGGGTGAVPVNWGRTYFVKIQFNITQ